MSISPLSNQTNSFLENIKIVTNNLSLKDQIYITTEVSWLQYEAMTQYFVDQSHYRTSYLEGTLQIMSPGRNHEKIKEYISGLLEAYFQEVELDYYPLGSTTFKINEQTAGKEPDFCYCLETEKEFPDLAIEVIFASGSIDIHEIYRRLQVKEVWCWQNERLKIYYLTNDEYAEVTSSQVLPNLDIELLIQYIFQPNLRLAIRDFKLELQK